jgi:hypothetical protein
MLPIGLLRDARVDVAAQPVAEVECSAQFSADKSVVSVACGEAGRYQIPLLAGENCFGGTGAIGHNGQSGR